MTDVANVSATVTKKRARGQAPSPEVSKRAKLTHSSGVDPSAHDPMRFPDAQLPLHLYEVSSEGRYLDLKRKSRVITHGIASRSGYLQVSIGKETRWLVHRVVATAFLPVPSVTQARALAAEQWTVDHVDGDRQNNSVSNLRWATMKEQSADMRKRRPVVWKTSHMRIRARKVGEETWSLFFESQKEASRQLKISRISIYRVISQKASQAWGYVFEHDPEQCADLPDEEWVPAKDANGDLFEGYFVSTKGRIRQKQGTVARGHKNVYGYRTVRLYTASGAKQHVLLHRLILFSFRGPSSDPAKNTVNHIDRNPDNNCLENLEWASQSEQIRHSFATNLSRGCSSEQRKDAIRCYWVASRTPVLREKDNGWTACRSAQDAAKQTGLSARSARTLLCNLRSKKPYVQRGKHTLNKDTRAFTWAPQFEFKYVAKGTAAYREVLYDTTLPPGWKPFADYGSVQEVADDTGMSCVALRDACNERETYIVRVKDNRTGLLANKETPWEHQRSDVFWCVHRHADDSAWEPEEQVKQIYVDTQGRVRVAGEPDRILAKVKDH